MDRVIYLDIDGVLNTWTDLQNLIRGDGQFLQYNKGDFVEVGKLTRLQELIERVNARVVVVSSWVCLDTTSKKVCDFLNVPYYGEPLCTGGGVERGRKVKVHMQQNGFLDHQVVIIDDGGDRMYEDLSRCVVVNGRVGLTGEDCEQVIRLFEGAA